MLSLLEIGTHLEERTVTDALRPTKESIMRARHNLLLDDPSFDDAEGCPRWMEIER